MELFLIRHAIAEDGEDDDARPLSPKGIKRFKDTAVALKLLEIRFDRIFHSPKLRAAQTADLLETLLDGKMEQTPLLEQPPSGPMLELLSNSGNMVAVVGHEPYMSSLVAWLVTGDQGLGHAFELKKGSVVKLDGSPTPGGMRLRALMPPSMLRKMVPA